MTGPPAIEVALPAHRLPSHISKTLPPTIHVGTPLERSLGVQLLHCLEA